MSNRQTNPGAPVDLALGWNDHMARLLQHADSLLAEWEAAARRSGETLARTMKATVTEASPAIVEELRRRLAEGLRHDLARMQREVASTTRPRGLLVPALLGANLLLAVAFMVVMLRAPAAPAQLVAPAALPDAAPLAVKPAEPPRAPAPTPAPPPAPVCEGLLPGGKPDARAVAAACAKLVCGKDEARCDASLEVAARPRLKCKPKGDAARGYSADEPWLRECLKGK